MKKGDHLPALLRSKKTVLTYKDILLLWGEQGSEAAMVRLYQYARKGDLYRIRRGIYAKDKNYNQAELATRIFTPSYVSFETVLAKEGLTFQFYSGIFIASYLTREITIDGQVYSYRKIRNEILTNPAGVVHRDETSFATKERAFLDTLYINTNYHFDHLDGLDWNKVFEILPIYGNKRMAKNVKEIFELTTHTRSQ
jgi:predicted transcriptional regulator of viral defense system